MCTGRVEKLIDGGRKSTLDERDSVVIIDSPTMR